VAYCLQVTLKQRLRSLAPGLTPRSVLDKMAAIQMVDVHLPTTDGRTVLLSRYTEPEMDQAILLQRLKIALPDQLAATGCSNLAKPGPQSIEGMSPVGTVTLTEIIAVGAAGGKGTLNFQGQSYPFKLVGGVTGGGGAANTQAYGEVYNLHNISDFKGLYTQSSGRPGLVTSGASDLWLRNAAGVVLHLKGTQEGVTLSLGREEILIEML